MQDNIVATATDAYTYRDLLQQHHLLYWKNDVMTTFSLPAGLSVKNQYGIAVAGHVYVAAVAVDGNGITFPVLWTDGTVAVLPIPESDAGDNGGMQDNIVANATDAYTYGATGKQRRWPVTGHADPSGTYWTVGDVWNGSPSGQTTGAVQSGAIEDS